LFPSLEAGNLEINKHQKITQTFLTDITYFALRKHGSLSVRTESWLECKIFIQLRTFHAYGASFPATDPE